MGVLSEESIAWMNRIHIANLRGAHDAIDLEITFRARRRPDANGFIRKLNVQRIHVGFRIDRQRSDAEFLACADYPQRDLTTIGN